MKIGLLFPDYSCQFVGMGKELYDESRIMQENFEEASSCLGVNFVKLCFASSDSELAKIANAYPALFLTSVSIAQVLKEKGIAIESVAGFGVGELAAIAVAGGISIPDGLYFLSKYAELYEEALGNWHVGAFHVSGIESQELKKLCSEMSEEQHPVNVAVHLSDTEFIVTGTTAKLERLEELLATQNVKVKKHPVEAGMHSALMDPIIVFLAKYLTKVDFKNASIPVIASVDGKIEKEADPLQRRFIKQLQAPIQWNKVLKQCGDWDVIVQVGPGKKLAELAKRLYPDKLVFSINKPQDVESLKNLLVKNDVEKTEETVHEL